MNDGGNVGIGTTSPTGKLSITQTGVGIGDTDLYIESDVSPDLILNDTTNGMELRLVSGDSQGFIGTKSNHDLRFRTNNVDVMTIEAGGDVGIGTTSPDELLDIAGINTRLKLRDSSGNGNVGIILSEQGDGAGGDFNIVYEGLPNIFKINSSVVDNIFVSERSTGRVGINTSSSAQTLTVQGTINVTADGSGVNLFVASDGKVGIGMSAPTVKLQIEDISEPSLRLQAIESNPANAGSIFFSEGNDADQFRIIHNGAANTFTIRTSAVDNVIVIPRDSGNVGIGNTIPNATLHVSGNINASGNITSGSGSIMIDGTNKLLIIGNTRIQRVDNDIIFNPPKDVKFIFNTSVNVTENLTINKVLILPKEVQIPASGSTNIRRNDASGVVGIKIGVQGSDTCEDDHDSGAAYVTSTENGTLNYTVDQHGSCDPNNPSQVVHHLRGNNTGEVWRLDNPQADLFTWETKINGTPLLQLNRTGLLNVNNSFWVTSAGNVGIGTNAPVAPLEIQSLAASMRQTRYSDTDIQSAGLTVQRSGGTTVGTDVIVQDGWRIANFNLRGYDGATYRTAASIQAFIDGVPGAGDMPGRLTFLTTTDGDSSATERMRIDNAGNVGIGTTSPNDALEVIGNVRISGSLNATSINTTGDAYFATASGNVGIGTTEPDSDLHIHEDASGSNFAAITLSNDITGTSGTFGGQVSMLGENMRVVNKEPANLHLGVDNSFDLTIIQGGNVGIGTTSPDSKLTVIGSTNITTSLVVNNTLFVNDSRVGIGTTNVPSETMLSIGSIDSNLEGGQIQLMSVTGSTYTTSFYLDNFKDTFRIMTGTDSSSSSAKFALTENGDVGIGTITPQSKLDVKGTINATNYATTAGLGITASCASSTTLTVQDGIIVACS